MVDFLKNPDKYTALGAKIPKVSTPYLALCACALCPLWTWVSPSTRHASSAPGKYVDVVHVHGLLCMH